MQILTDQICDPFVISGGEESLCRILQLETTKAQKQNCSISSEKIKSRKFQRNLKRDENKLNAQVLIPHFLFVCFLFRLHGHQKKFIILERGQIQLKGILMHLWSDEVGFINRYFFFLFFFLFDVKKDRQNQKVLF